ncbi:MAG: RNA methyltransferase, partial [Polaribacter sp.]|nr:RNA methyltransferase [Polaribacter sp.]
IGPEGDFSTEEIKKALSKKFTPISLGKSRLRTETAALVAVNSVCFINE